MPHRRTLDGEVEYNQGAYACLLQKTCDPNPPFFFSLVANTQLNVAGGAVSCEVMSPGLSSVVSNTLVEGAPGAPNLTRPALVPSPLHCEPCVFRSHCFLLLLLRLIFNEHPQI